MHDRFLQIDCYFCVAAACLEWILSLNTPRQYCSPCIHLQCCNNQTTQVLACLFLFETQPEQKNWYLRWFVQAQTRYTQILSKNRLHAATTSSLDSSTYLPCRRFLLAFFLRKAIWIDKSDIWDDAHRIRHDRHYYYLQNLLMLHYLLMLHHASCFIQESSQFHFKLEE